VSKTSFSYRGTILFTLGDIGTLVWHLILLLACIANTIVFGVMAILGSWYLLFPGLFWLFGIVISAFSIRDDIRDIKKNK
jgi:1,4-dihydroxy-2-naphthoate octaprenyltransferase